MSFDYENSNQRAQTSTIQTKPVVVKFTYVTPSSLLPPQGPSQYMPSLTPIVNIVTPIPQQKRTIQCKTPIPLHGHPLKKRIFDQYDCSHTNPIVKRQKSLKTVPQQKKKEVVRSGIAHIAKIKRRRPIFASQGRKQISQFKTPPNRQNSASRFALHPYSHPNSVLSHFPTLILKDIKLKIQSKETLPLKNEKSHLQSQPQSEIVQEYSPVKLEVSIISDEPNNKSTDTQIIDPFFLSSERFFDKEMNSPPKKKISYKDVSLYDTLVNQTKSRETIKKEQPNSSYFPKSLHHLYFKVSGFKYPLPTILILLGLLLLLIQTSK